MWAGIKEFLCNFFQSSVIFEGKPGSLPECRNYQCQTLNQMPIIIFDDHFQASLIFKSSVERLTVLPSKVRVLPSVTIPTALYPNSFFSVHVG
jgi:hypothetical protein